MKYLTQEEAQKIDEELMGPEHKFSIDQLMELAGLSCACAVAEEFNPTQHPRVLVVCGPGNNGGDGLVCARHLHHFGFAPTVVVPKPPSKPLYQNLQVQCQKLGIEVLPAMPTTDTSDSNDQNYHVIVDAVFGFSFAGDVRPPFDAVMQILRNTRVPIVSIDIPSGWHVEQGNVSGLGVVPHTLVSLTAPKMCASRLTPATHHYIGGRFVPPSLALKYGLVLPVYPKSAQCVKLLTDEASSASAASCL
eukprot:c26346_g1_i1.p1 GENE.c26346_g1_i1~~c26346_g1_i1.p1  ORF type:complete len:248 (+),score=72.96 c26346_g1_i1:168-911(+)